MPPISIRDLSEADSVSAGDLLPVSVNGATRSVDVATLKTYCLTDISFTDDKVTEFSSPTSSPATINFANETGSIFLYWTPTTTIAAASFALPGLGVAVDKQEILVKVTQIITALTFTATDLTISADAPTTLAANDYFRMRFEGANGIWLRVG